MLNSYILNYSVDVSTVTALSRKVQHNIENIEKMNDQDISVQQRRTVSLHIEIFNPVKKEQNAEPSTSLITTTTTAATPSRKPQVLNKKMHYQENVWHTKHQIKVF